MLCYQNDAISEGELLNPRFTPTSRLQFVDVRMETFRCDATMLRVDLNAVVMHDLDESMAAVLTDLSALKRDANVGLCLLFVLKNRTFVPKATASVLPDSFFCIPVFQPGFIFKIRQ